MSLFRLSGILDTDSITYEGKRGNTAFLKSGWTHYAIGEDSIHIGTLVIKSIRCGRWV